MNSLGSFLVSFLASLAVVVFVYWGLQGLSSWDLRKRKVGETKCWFLPRWNCFRLVIRNIPGHHTFHFLQWRVWLRSVIPAQPGSSVDTFVDTDLESGERIYLPIGQDIPMVCFRFDDTSGTVKLLVTDKLGNVLNSHDLDNVDSIMAEYHVEIRHWVVFKHSINRIARMPLTKKEEIKGETEDFLRDYYLAKQKDSSQNGKESQVKVYGEEEVSLQL